MGLTTVQAGHLLDITGGTLRNIENEQRPASLALAYRASRLFKVPVEELVRDEDEEPKPKPEPKTEPKVEPTSPPRRKNGRDDNRRPRGEDDMEQAS